MRIEEDTKLDFCDVLIRPKRSESPSRSTINLYRDFVFKTSGHEWHGMPVFAANMDTTGSFAMAKALAQYQMQTCLNKHHSVSMLVDFFSHPDTADSVYHTWYTLGIMKDDFEKFDEVYTSSDKNVRNVCIDVANGYSAFFADRVKLFREKYPDVNIMAGNVATPEMVQELLMNGVDIVKVGIGPGSVCITRKVAGVGYPQLSAVIECADAAHGLGGHICADGGCTTSGDIAKAFGGGSDFVMLGGMFAGTDECDGEWEYHYELEEIEQGNSEYVKAGKKSLSFYGMSSEDAMNKYSGGVAAHRAPEGKKVTIPYKGPVEGVIQDIEGGLRSACTYVGAMKLKDLSKCTTFVKVRRTHNTIYGQ